ncbi:AraC family transcriptional regulator [Sinorhizobium sp. NFACC03]|uniref:AraC family transcriptional regulator n=1 Tax=Sinorhizobium sp. NFACC03 TaxID=1566295 RepID=UPI00088ACCF2|nr:AraC family transcriptional regulator [Sinorhizobium sp. NFACC03]SDA59045.1 hypothetical protein SAMN03159448_01582 [Sinorhizobium sp. NFACC03]
MVIHLRRDDAGVDQLQWLIRELVQDTMAAAPGADAARSGLAHLMFLQILRGYLSRERGVNVGWLRAACDPKLAPALSLMHGDPTRNWHLPELARAAAMFRTAFATYFKAVAGIAPLSYLAEWRMRLAERKLQDGGQSVAMVAQSVGTLPKPPSAPRSSASWAARHGSAPTLDVRSRRLPATL